VESIIRHFCDIVHSESIDAKSKSQTHKNSIVHYPDSTPMAIFVVCSAAAAAGLTFAFESGKVFERRVSGVSKDGVLFQDYDWTGRKAKTTAAVFAAIVAIEILLFPRSWNPFTYIFDASGDASYLRMFTVFGSWSGILAVGFGSITTLSEALAHERKQIETAKLEHEKQRLENEKYLEDEKQLVSKEMRIVVASAAANAGERRQINSCIERKQEAIKVCENERVWSKTLCEQFNKKTINMMDNAIDKRWREVEYRGVNIEEMRRRNLEKEKKIKEQRARRVERVNAQQSELEDEKEKLRKLTDELDHLKANMEKLKEENMAREQQKLKELKDREEALREREENLEQSHHQRLEKLTEKENELRIREERFESGVDKQELERKSQKLENSMSNVARFKKEIEISEKAKLEEINRQRNELLKQREEIMEMAQKREEEVSRREDELEEILNRREIELTKRECIAERKETELMKREEELTKTAIDIEKPVDTAIIPSQRHHEERCREHETSCRTHDQSLSVTELLRESHEVDLESNEAGKDEEALASQLVNDYELNCPSEEQDELVTPTVLNGETVEIQNYSHANRSFEPTSLFDLDEDEDESICSIDKEMRMNPLVCVEEDGSRNGFEVTEENEECSEQQQKEQNLISDNCDNEKSLLDNFDGEQEDVEKSLLDNDSNDDEEEIDDDSTCMLNDNYEYRKITASQSVDQEVEHLEDQVIREDDVTADQLHVIEERESFQVECQAVEEGTGKPEGNSSTHEVFNSDSKDDSLSCQIQQDIAKKNGALELNLDSVDPCIEESRDKNIPSITSPLQEIRNAIQGSNTNRNFSCGNIDAMAFDTAPYKTEFVISPISATSSGSRVSSKDDFPKSPTKKHIGGESFEEMCEEKSNRVDEGTEIEKENDALTTLFGKNENNNTSLVVSEETAVEVIAWDEQGLF